MKPDKKHNDQQNTNYYKESLQSKLMNLLIWFVLQENNLLWNPGIFFLGLLISYVQWRGLTMILDVRSLIQGLCNLFQCTKMLSSVTCFPLSIKVPPSLWREDSYRLWFLMPKIWDLPNESFQSLIQYA